MTTHRRTQRLRGLFFTAALGLPSSVTACIPDVVPDPSSLPQCASLEAVCGPEGTDDCCSADEVPGGKFDRINNAMYPAQVRTFHLDRYEVTVGRFRAFVTGYPLNRPVAGDGASPSVGPESGWDPEWDDHLPTDRDELLAEIQCDQLYARWTDSPAENENQPMNCISWYVASAFCAWDGGRLPTDAEWNYAAAAGNDQRLYPWGDMAPDDTLAVFGCESNLMTCEIPAVGSTPAGKGLWGQMDLAGSMAEWTLDYYGDLPTACADKCALLEDAGLGRTLRGGDFTRMHEKLMTTYQIGIFPEDVQSFIGFRCARDL